MLTGQYNCAPADHSSLRQTSTAPPKVIDLKDVQLTKGAVDVLSDLLSVEFGLKKLVLENCGLDDEVRVVPHSKQVHRGPTDLASGADT